MIIYIEKCRKDVQTPDYANKHDACMDIRAAEDTLIDVGKTVIVPSGLKMCIPIGHELQIKPRSGISLNTPLRISNSPATIDSGYRDEVGILVSNTSMNCSSRTSMSGLLISEKGNKHGKYFIKKGDRIAQIKVVPAPVFSFVEVDSVAKFGTNRAGGFGSTGVT